MRSLVIIAAILCVVGSAICQTAPKLPQQFYTNFTLELPDYVPTDSTVHISGFFALDYVNGGSFLEVGGEEYVPLSFHTSLVASPDASQGIVTGYMYEGPLCWNIGSIPASLLTFFPFQLPSNASFVGNKVIAGQSCSGWEFNADVFGISSPVTIWVSTKTTTIVQINVEAVEYVGGIQLNFFNTVTGPFSPSIYAPPNKVNPNLTCTNTFASNLLPLLFRK